MSWDEPGETPQDESSEAGEDNWNWMSEGEEKAGGPRRARRTHTWPTSARQAARRASAAVRSALRRMDSSTALGGIVPSGATEDPGGSEVGGPCEPSRQGAKHARTHAVTTPSRLSVTGECPAARHALLPGSHLPCYPAAPPGQLLRPCFDEHTVQPPAALHVHNHPQPWPPTLNRSHARSADFSPQQAPRVASRDGPAAWAHQSKSHGSAGGTASVFSHHAPCEQQLGPDVLHGAELIKRASCAVHRSGAPNAGCCSSAVHAPLGSACDAVPLLLPSVRVARNSGEDARGDPPRAHARTHVPTGGAGAVMSHMAVPGAAHKHDDAPGDMSSPFAQLIDAIIDDDDSIDLMRLLAETPTRGGASPSQVCTVGS